MDMHPEAGEFHSFPKPFAYRFVQNLSEPGCRARPSDLPRSMVNLRFSLESFNPISMLAGNYPIIRGDRTPTFAFNVFRNDSPNM